jgi:hypothetical protein
VTARGAELLERLREIAENIREWDAAYEALRISTLEAGRAWTDPRNGQTYFPPKRARTLKGARC